MSRCDWSQTFLDMALLLARSRGTCLRRNYGAIIVDERKRIIATGYTGVPSHQLHCVTCWREDNNIPPGERYEECKSVHAEMNALIQAGDRATGCYMYIAGCTKECELDSVEPCLMCSKLMVNSDIQYVISKVGGIITYRKPQTILQKHWEMKNNANKNSN